jgi:hypothetical protein
VSNPLRNRLAHALDRRLRSLRDALTEEIRAAAAQGRTEAAAAAAEHDRRLAAIERRQERLDGALRAVADDERGNRARLWALRADPQYAAAWEEDEPLVTVSLTVRDRPALLAERSLPSVLAQSYERLQVVVVGDDATPAVQAVMRDQRDPRVSFTNLTTRVVKETETAHWLSAATQPRNEGYRQAAGRWTLDFDDDDALLPRAIERLLALARSERAEVAYGAVVQHAPDGTVCELGGFPPQPGFSFAPALAHSGLRFIAREHVASIYGLPGDWYRAERMVRIGVRFAYVAEPMLDYYPSSLWSAAGGGLPDGAR